ncbi:MAG: hypothetical protein ACREFR_20150 [Limisphaerales bacterium]
MRVVSHPEADEELKLAARWYDAQRPILGEDFLEEFERTLLRKLANPNRQRKILGEHRKLNFYRAGRYTLYQSRNAFASSPILLVASLMPFSAVLAALPGWAIRLY